MIHKLIEGLVHHKCIITQGAAFVQMFMIFFIGGVSIQSWIEKHFQYSINVAVPVVVAVIAAWVIGRIMLATGMIKSEQSWYFERNRVLDELRQQK